VTRKKKKKIEGDMPGACYFKPREMGSCREKRRVQGGWGQVHRKETTLKKGVIGEIRGFPFTSKRGGETRGGGVQLLPKEDRDTIHEKKRILGGGRSFVPCFRFLQRGALERKKEIKKGKAHDLQGYKDGGEKKRSHEKDLKSGGEKEFP